MNIHGPVVVIEDDLDDQLILQEVFEKLNYSNKIIFFGNGEDALDYLNRSEIIPFIILSDINMPRMDGFELRNRIHTNSELHVKCIPYLFFSTAASQKVVMDAYSLSVQGFFIKQTTLAGMAETIKIIMEYWKRCVAPNHFGIN